MKRPVFSILMLLILILIVSGQVHAQDSVFPLPAPLYILTSDHQILRVDPQSGEQTLVSPEGQRVLDFDIAPDGEWYAYRTEDNGAVIVSAMKTGSGYVVEFLDRAPQPGSGLQTIGWSPDVSALAYIVPDGVRIAALGAGDYGAPLFSTIQGPWVELYWADAETVIALDAAGETWRISGTSGQWTVEQIEGPSALPQPVIPSYLTEEGVWWPNEYTVVPRTAGALSYDWGPLALPLFDGLVLPTNLYFLSSDAQGIAQVWQLPANGEPVRALTAESADVAAYAVARTGGQIANIVADELFVSDLSGANRQLVATLQAGDLPPSVAWSPDGTRLAFHDGRGVWTVPADGSRPQRVVINHHLPANQTDAVNIELYFNPRWSPDGSRLLVGIGFWEGSVLGVLDVQTGELIQLRGLTASEGLWTDDGRVIAWASAWGYTSPGLFLLDPAQPDAAPVAVLESGTPVVDAVRHYTSGDWFIGVATTAEMGPQYVRVLVAEQPAGPFGPVPYHTAGGFIRQPQLFAPPGGPIRAAGLRDITYTDTGQVHGDLVILNMQTGDTVQIDTLGPVWDMMWQEWNDSWG